MGDVGGYGVSKFLLGLVEPLEDVCLCMVGLISGERVVLGMQIRQGFLCDSLESAWERRGWKLWDEFLKVEMYFTENSSKRKEIILNCFCFEKMSVVQLNF